MSMANASTTTVVPDGHTYQFFNLAESSAMRTAKLQAAGLPWPCVKHKITVTNAKCKEMKIASDTRQCSDCGLPLSLGIVTREELKMGKTQLVVGQDVPKVETVEVVPSWDDFTPVSALAKAPVGSLHVNIRPGRYCTISGPLARRLGWKDGEGIECAIGENALALKWVPEWKSGETYKITKTAKSDSLRVGCGLALKAAQAPKGSFAVTVAPWGVVIHLDRPVVGKA